jgi:hypothetical protein
MVGEKPKIQVIETQEGLARCFDRKVLYITSSHFVPEGVLLHVSNYVFPSHDFEIREILYTGPLDTPAVNAIRTTDNVRIPVALAWGVGLPSAKGDPSPFLSRVGKGLFIGRGSFGNPGRALMQCTAPGHFGKIYDAILGPDGSEGTLPLAPIEDQTYEDPDETPLTRLDLLCACLGGLNAASSLETGYDQNFRTFFQYHSKTPHGRGEENYLHALRYLAELGNHPGLEPNLRHVTRVEMALFVDRVSRRPYEFPAAKESLTLAARLAMEFLDLGHACPTPRIPAAFHPFRETWITTLAALSRHDSIAIHLMERLSVNPSPTVIRAMELDPEEIRDFIDERMRLKHVYDPDNCRESPYPEPIL